MTNQEKLKYAAEQLKTEGNQPWNIGFALQALCEWAAAQTEINRPTDEVTK
jgi:hypothetical protein